MKPQRQRTQRVCVNNTVMFLRLTSRNQRNNYSLMSLLLIFFLYSQVFAWTTIANTCCSIFSQLAMSYCLKNTFKRFYLSICFFLNICVGTCVSLYAPSACRCPKMPEGDGSSGTGVPGSCEVPEVASGNWTLLLGKSSFSLNFWTIFPVPVTCFL